MSESLMDEAIKGVIRDRLEEQFSLDEIPPNLKGVIESLLSALERKDKAIKLLQFHCAKRFNAGLQVGLNSNNQGLKEATAEIARLRKQLSDDNATFTEEIMRLEERLNK